MEATIRERRRGGYETDRPDVQALVPRSAGRILDLGCASGALGAALKRRQGAEVVGIELDPGYARDAEDRLDRVVCADLVAGLEEDLGTFDCVVAADVLEHLRDPEPVLRMLRRYVRPGGRLVVSLPNVAHASVRAALLVGRFPYRETGILDRTHLRLFTFETAQELVRSAGFRVEAAYGGSDRFGPVVNARIVGPLLRGLLAFSIVVLARPA